MRAELLVYPSRSLINPKSSNHAPRPARARSPTAIAMPFSHARLQEATSLAERDAEYYNTDESFAGTVRDIVAIASCTRGWASGLEELSAHLGADLEELMEMSDINLASGDVAGVLGAPRASS